MANIGRIAADEAAEIATMEEQGPAVERAQYALVVVQHSLENTPEEEQEEPEQEEVTAADDLSLLDRLRQGGLAHVDATEPYEPVIDYSDDDDYAFIDDTDRDY